MRVTNLVNTTQSQQFKCIAASFNVLGLKIAKEDANRLLGQHFELQKMHTQRSFENMGTKMLSKQKSAIKEENSNEESDFEEEDLDSDDQI